MQKTQNTTLWLLSGITFLDMLGVGIMIPVIPALFTDSHSAFFLLKDAYISYAFLLLGAMTSIYSLMQFIASPILGSLSDRYGRKKVLAISLFGTCIGYLLFVLGMITKSLPLLFLSRAIDGITGGNISVAQAAISDISKPADRSKNFGMLMAGFGLGFILGPTIGGILGDINPTFPFILSAILSFISFLILIITFRETNLSLSKDAISYSPITSLATIIKSFSHRILASTFIIFFLVSIGFTFFTSFSGAFLIDVVHASQKDIGLFFGFLGIWIVITQVFINRKISYYGESITIGFPILLLSASLLLYGISHNFILLYIIAPFLAISHGLSQANLIAKMSKNADPSEQGKVLGIKTSLNCFAQGMVPLFAGIFATQLSIRTPIILGAIVTFCTGILFFYKRRENLLST
jgi:MFS transporter, DHA1 family, tetracycline resistance protein